MRLTLLKAKEALKGKAPADKLEYRLNRASERLMTSGKYNGSMHRIALAAPYGQLTLPRHYRTIEGVKDEGGTVYDITNHWYEFLPGHSEQMSFSMRNIRDLGDGHAIMRDLPSAGTIAQTYAGAPGIEVVTTIYGTSSMGLPLEMVLTGDTAQVNAFAHIDRIAKQGNTPPVVIAHTSDAAILTPLAIMAPTEEETFYRRYLMDSLSTTANNAVVVLAKLRHIEFTSDKDVLPFSNISALELALDALQYEAENDHNIADAYWNKAIKVLNDELGDTNSNNTMPIIRFIYPGNTAPNFRSPM